MQTVDVGEQVTLESHWYDDDGAGVDPTTITLTVVHPDGTVDTYDKTDLTQGDTVADWSRAVTATAEGYWSYTFLGTINAEPVEQSGGFLVGVRPAGPCEPWCSWADVEACGASVSGIIAPVCELAVDLATELLWNLSGRVYDGLCTTTRSLCYGCAMCYPSCCACEPVNGIDLGSRAPVWGVTDVVVDGVALDPSAYTLRGRRWLVRTDDQAWPSGWNTVDPDAFRATWTYGRPPPIGGQRAAALLAREIALQCVGQPCALPSRVTSVSREGMSFQVVDPNAMIDDGRTGMAAVDLWVAADAHGRKTPPRIFSPAAASARRIP